MHFLVINLGEALVWFIKAERIALPQYVCARRYKLSYNWEGEKEARPQSQRQYEAIWSVISTDCV